MQELFNSMWFAYQRGDITEKTWLLFCDDVMEQLLTEFEESLVRIKNM